MTLLSKTMQSSSSNVFSVYIVIFDNSLLLKAIILPDLEISILVIGSFVICFTSSNLYFISLPSAFSLASLKVELLYSSTLFSYAITCPKLIFSCQLSSSSFLFNFFKNMSFIFSTPFFSSFFFLSSSSFFFLSSSSILFLSSSFSF